MSESKSDSKAGPKATSMCPYRAFVRLLDVHQICHTVQCHIDI
jgi:hypothetical protein